MARGTLGWGSVGNVMVVCEAARAKAEASEHELSGAGMEQVGRITQGGHEGEEAGGGTGPLCLPKTVEVVMEKVFEFVRSEGRGGNVSEQ